jgi:anti-anti-sigma regulatory factor/anti-sigma regulatory factor (Ser/Thr protein kinase)
MVGQLPWGESPSPVESGPTALRVSDRAVEGAVVARPVGELDVATAPTLRDALLKRAAEHPRAVIVDLSELVVSRTSLLTVLAVVWSRMQAWSSVPLMVVGSARRLGTMGVPASVPVYPTLEAALSTLDEPAERLLAERTLAASLTSAAESRRFVRETLDRWSISFDDDTAESAVIIVNELVQNVVRHTPVAEMRIRLDWHAPWLRLAVADGDLNPAVLREQPGEGGFGLLIVARLSHAWGCAPHPSGSKVVWAVLKADKQR